MAVEVEAKFLAPDLAALDALARVPTLGDATLGRPATVDEIDLYLDTAGGHLAAARWACRLRNRGDGFRVSLKGPPEDSDATGWLHRRPEVEGAATASTDPRAWPPGRARDLAYGLSEGAPLVEQLRLAQRRTEREVRLGARRIGTLSLDAVTVRRGHLRVGVVHVVELELEDGENAGALVELGRLAEALLALGLAADDRTKLERAFEMLGAG
jgi:inorganic triphosphatase YgiF